MSKSLGNVLLVRDLLQQAPGEAIRLALLSAHYRAPLDWTDDAPLQAKRRLDGLYQCLRDLGDIACDKEQSGKAPQAFIDALDDDLNTPRALAELSALARSANATRDAAGRARLKSQILACADLLGILQQDPEAWFAGNAEDLDTALIDQLIVERDQARRAKDFAKADRVRDQLTALGVVIEDSAEGTRWRRL